MIKKYFLLILALQVAPQIGAVEIACPVEKAQYQLRADRDYSARFHPTVKEDGRPLFLAITSKHSQLTYWFTLGQGNGYSDAYVSASAAPSGPKSRGAIVASREKGNAELSFFTLSKDLSISSEEPRYGSPAFQYFFIPELGPKVWYLPENFGGSFDPTLRERIPRGLFELSACDE